MDHASATDYKFAKEIEPGVYRVQVDSHYLKAHSTAGIEMTLTSKLRKSADFETWWRDSCVKKRCFCE